jgi:predicted Zn-dependent protease
MPVPLRLFLATALTAVSVAAQTTLSESQLVTRCDPPPGSLGRLTRNQKEGFQKSQDMFVSGHYADALGELRGLLAQLPQNTSAQRAMAERTAEAALEAGERAYAISLLKPIEERDGNDCSARTLLARALRRTGSLRSTTLRSAPSLHFTSRLPNRPLASSTFSC